MTDERDGPGIVVYPDGRRYTSTWSAGKDVNAKDAPVAARAYVMVGVDVRRYALDGDIFAKSEERGNYLTYRGRFTDGDFVIEPDWAGPGCMVERRTSRRRYDRSCSGGISCVSRHPRL